MGYAQGTTYQIKYFSTDSIFTQSQADSILNSLDSSLSLYKPYSVVNSFNKSSAGIKLDSHLLHVVRKALEVSVATAGAFDITALPLVNAWGFGVQKITEMPDSATIARLMRCVGSYRLELSGEFLKKELSCVQLDVNGIAQGYSVDVLATFIESKGITDYLVELGGEMRIKGNRAPGDAGWQVGILAPHEDVLDPPTMKTFVRVGNGAVTTSGTYNKFYESNGKRITHIINLRTGTPIQNEMVSVAVRARDAMTADAYDNALMVLGVEQGLLLAKRVGIEAFFIYRTPEGKLSDTATTGFFTRRIID